jgi:protein-arginine kinase activator protein McsA
MAKEIRRRKPLSEQERLSKELDVAVRVEDYEKAALLRDRIKVLRETKRKK